MSEQLIVNSKNILGWLQLIADIFPLEEEEREMIINYIKRTDEVRRQKEIDEIFGGEYDGY